jgi:hypothetical protein
MKSGRLLANLIAERGGIKNSSQNSFKVWIIKAEPQMESGFVFCI